MKIIYPFRAIILTIAILGFAIPQAFAETIPFVNIQQCFSAATAARAAADDQCDFCDTEPEWHMCIGANDNEYDSAIAACYRRFPRHSLGIESLSVSPWELFSH